MKITQHSSASTLTLNLDGELDASSSVSLDTELGKPATLLFQKVLINCKQLNYISSAGLGVFISHLQQFQDAGVKLIFFNMQDKVHNVFEILGLDTLMTIVSSETEATAI